MNKQRYQAYIAKQRSSHNFDVCEFCGKEHDHSYGSGRFCSKTCKSKFVANINRNASPNTCKHLAKLRDQGKIAVQALYGTWHCKTCKDHPIFSTRAELYQHQVEVHGKRPIVQNTCPYCGKQFTSRLQVMGHLASCQKHPDKIYHDEAQRRAHATYSEKCKANPYMNGWLGRHHTKETREKISIVRSKQVMNEFLPKVYVHTKWYKVTNIKGEEFSVRGTWEVNVSKHLNELGIYWIKAHPIPYQSDIVRHYTPDFYIPEQEIFIEVKGRYPEEDKLKMRLILEQYPDMKIYFIHKCYQDFISGKQKFDNTLRMTLSDTE